jgi:hypothetical protein
LVDAWVRRLEEWEASLPEGAEERLFDVPMSEQPRERGAPAFDVSLELIAVKLGIKPACRFVAAESEIEPIRTAARDADLHCEAMHAASFISRFSTRTRAWPWRTRRCNNPGTTLLYVARTVDATLSARDAEHAMIATDGSVWRRRAPYIRKLGAALGYPTCCIEAFLPVRNQPNTTIRFRALRAKRADPVSFV